MIKSILNSMKEENINTDENGRIIIDYELSKRIMLAIKERKVPLILDESDLLIKMGDGMPNSETYSGELFTSLDDIVAVHVSPVPPIEDTIITKESAGVKDNMIFVDPTTQKEHNVAYLVGNDTIHFTLNCVVHNHSSGNDWDSYRYGVLTNFQKLDKTKILDVKSEDTYIDGNVELGYDYFLFCPLGEGEKIGRENPGACVIEYDGISLSQAISCMILYSGYKLEPYGTYGWGRNHEYGLENPDVFKLEELVSHEGYPVLKGQFGNALHSETKYMARRMWKKEYEALINLIEYNNKNNIEMPDEVLFMVMVYGGAYSIPGTVPVTLEDYKATVLPILGKYDYDVDDSLFEGVEVDKDMKLIYFTPDSNGLPIIDCPHWENVLRSRIVDMLKDSKKNNLTDGDVGIKKV